MIYEARGARPGQRIALRDEDLDVLAGLVGDDPNEVECRLIELMECTPEEARSLRALLFRRRVVAAAAGIVLGLAVAPHVSWTASEPGAVGIAVDGDSAMGFANQPDGGADAGFALGDGGPAPATLGSSVGSGAQEGEQGPGVVAPRPDGANAPTDGAPPASVEPSPGPIDIGTAIVITRPLPEGDDVGPDVPETDAGDDSDSPNVNPPAQAPPFDDGTTDGDGAEGGGGDGAIVTDGGDGTEADGTDGTDGGDAGGAGDEDGDNGQGVGVGETPPGHQDDPGDGGDAGGAGDGDGDNGQGVGVGETPPGHQDDPGDGGGTDGGTDGGATDGGSTGGGGGGGHANDNASGNNGQGVGVGETPPGHQDEPAVGGKKK